MIDAKWLIIVFFYTKGEENGNSLFKRKRQSRSNCCPFDRKPYPDEKIKIGARDPGKGRETVTLAQEEKTMNWRLKI